MKNPYQNHKKGFTIIETILVFGVGSLIFLAFAIAIPTLVRNQRDADRQASFSKLLSRINQYQANNRKALPTFEDQSGTVTAQLFYEEGKALTTTGVGWNEFIKDYLIRPFEDPNGNLYNISITSCNTGVGTGNSCKGNSEAGTETEYKINKLGTKKPISEFFTQKFPNNNIVLIVVNAKCSGTDDIIAYPGNNTVSILYRLENSGTYCENN